MKESVCSADFAEHPGRVGTIMVVGGRARLPGRSPLGTGPTGSPRQVSKFSEQSVCVTKTDEITLNKQSRPTYMNTLNEQTESVDIEATTRGTRYK